MKPNEVDRSLGAIGGRPTAKENEDSKIMRLQDIWQSMFNMGRMC